MFLKRSVGVPRWRPFHTWTDSGGPVRVWVRRIYTGDHRTAHMDYHLSAAQFPSGDVVLYITTGGFPSHTSSEDTAALWRDIVQCCVYGGFPEAALILKTLPYQRNSLGAFEIKGSFTATTGNLSFAGRSAGTPGARQPVGVGEVFPYPGPRAFQRPSLGRPGMGGRSRDCSAAVVTPCTRDTPGVTVILCGLRCPGERDNTTPKPARAFLFQKKLLKDTCLCYSCLPRLGKYASCAGEGMTCGTRFV